MRCFLLTLLLAGCDGGPISLGAQNPDGGGGDGGGLSALSFNTSSIKLTGRGVDLIARDFDEDGHVDLVISSNPQEAINLPAGGRSSLSFFRGRGDGTFDPPIDTTMPSGLLATGDLDGDGHLDLVIGNATYGADPIFANFISVLRGHGDGSFELVAGYGDGTIAAGPRGLALADLDGDGKLDAIYTHGSLYDSAGQSTPGDTVATRLGNGDGTFQDERTISLGVIELTNLLVADVDGDGKPDAVVGVDVGGIAHGGIARLSGNGDGTFQPVQWIAHDTGPCRAVAALDFDGDGVLDLATGDCTTPNLWKQSGLWLLRGHHDGTFDPTLVSTGDLIVEYSITVADLDRNGSDDVTFPQMQTENELFLLGGGQTETLSAASQVPIGFNPYYSIAADFNGDGAPDLAVIHALPSAVAVLLNNSPPGVQ